MKDDKKITLEDAFAQLEDIVEQLEQGDVPLERLIKEYEKGISLITECRQQLQNAEQKVQQLSKQADGNLIIEPFED